MRVCVRVRPNFSEESSNCIDVTEEGGVVTTDHSFTFANSIMIGAEQSVAFDALGAPLIDKLLVDGYNCSLLAYGQTGSGKTYTMFGPPGSLTEASLEEGDTPSLWGVFPRTVLELLKRLGAGSTLHASAVEVYQEKAYDLLADRAPLTVGSKSSGRKVGGGKADLYGNHLGSKGSAGSSHHGAHPPACRCGKCWKKKEEELQARLAKRDNAQQQKSSVGGKRTSNTCQEAVLHEEGHDETFSTVGERLWPLETPADVARLARTVEVTRVAESHLLNVRSSRSHCLVHLHLTQHQGGKISKKTLLFVDLAGSERIMKSGVEGTARAQATAINGSLTVLGKVVRSLSDKASHVPFRDSSLTMLLRGALSGKAWTSVVINVASEVQHADETLCSLEFGKRMTSVKNKTSVVVGRDSAREMEAIGAQLAAVREEIEDMERAGLSGGRFGPNTIPSEQRQFEDNVRRLAIEERKVHRGKHELTELRARSDPDTKIEAALTNQVRQAELERGNLKDIILRQKSISGFWIPPTPGFVKKSAEASALEAKLMLVTSIPPCQMNK